MRWWDHSSHMGRLVAAPIVYHTPRRFAMAVASGIHTHHPSRTCGAPHAAAGERWGAVYRPTGALPPQPGPDHIPVLDMVVCRRHAYIPTFLSPFLLSKKKKKKITQQ